MRKTWIEIDNSLISFIEVIEHTKEIIEFIGNSKSDLENLDALIINIKNALIATKQDVNGINKNTLTKYVENLKKSRTCISFIMNKSINNIESLIASLPKDNYDSMSKEELIALLREKK